MMFLKVIATNRYLAVSDFNANLTLTRSRPKLNCGPGRDFEVGPEFGAARKQPIIPGNSRARSCAGEADRVT